MYRCALPVVVANPQKYKNTIILNDQILHFKPASNLHYLHGSKTLQPPPRLAIHTRKFLETVNRMLINFKTGGLPKGKALGPTPQPKQALMPFEATLECYPPTISFSQGLLKPDGFASTPFPSSQRRELSRGIGSPINKGRTRGGGRAKT